MLLLFLYLFWLLLTRGECSEKRNLEEFICTMVSSAAAVRSTRSGGHLRLAKDEAFNTARTGALSSPNGDLKRRLPLARTSLA